MFLKDRYTLFVSGYLATEAIESYKTDFIIYSNAVIRYLLGPQMCSHVPRKKRLIAVRNMPRLTKDQTIWICLEHARVDNALRSQQRRSSCW